MALNAKLAGAAAKQPKPDYFLSKPPKKKDKKTSAAPMGGLLSFPTWEQATKGEQFLPTNPAEIQPISGTPSIETKQDSKSRLNKALGQTGAQMAGQPLVDAMARFDADNPDATKEYRDRIKYRLQRLSEEDPTFASYSRRFGTDLYDTYREYRKVGADELERRMLADQAGNLEEGAVKWVTDFLAGATHTGLDKMSATERQVATKQIEEDPAMLAIRPATKAAANVFNPAAIMLQGSDFTRDPKQFAVEMGKSFGALFDPASEPETRAASGINWIFLLTAGKHLVERGTVSREMVDTGTQKAIEILNDAPDTPAVRQARQLLKDVPELRGQDPQLAAPKTGQPPEPSAIEPQKRRAFSEDLAVNRLQQKLEATGKVTAQQAQDLATLMKERGRAHAKTTGGSVQAFWEELVPEIRTMDYADYQAQRSTLHQADHEAFYSHAERVADSKLPNRGSAEQMRQTMLGAGVKADELQWLGLDDLFETRQGEQLSKADILDTIRENRIQLGEDVRTGPDAKFARYVEPGGENYRELLIRLPEGRPEGDFLYGHFEDAPNVVAHVRMNDRTGTNGERILHIEEIQSDWHQKGRDTGYSDPKQAAEAARVRDSLLDERGFITNGQFEQLPAATQSLLSTLDKTPAAPFSKTWHELAVKRILNYAAEHGYDQVTWTTGEMQTNRFSLGNELSSLTWDPKKNAVRGVDLNGVEVLNQEGITPEKLAELVGKSAAEKLTGGEGDRIRTLKGQQLRTVAPGMSRFYDETLPRYVDRYTKKWGGQVRESVLPGSGAKVHTLDMTDQIRYGVREGQPMFQESGAKGTVKGAVDFAHDKAVITLFENADVSTVVHEFTHVWRRQLVGDDLGAIKSWLKVDGDRWTVAQEERFARGMERYLMTGRAPTEKLAGIFARFKSWLKEIYVSVKASPQIDVKISPQVREVFDRMFSEELAGRPREADLAAARREREQLAALDPHDPQLDPFADDYNPQVVAEIRDQLGGDYADRKTPQQILTEIQERMFTEAENAAMDQATRDEILQYIGTPKSGPDAPLIAWHWDSKRGGWFPDYRQGIGWIDASDFPEHVSRMIEEFRDGQYLDPDYRLVERNTSQQWSGGTARPPDGALTVSEYASKEAFSGEQGYNKFPVPLLKAFREHIDGGGGVGKSLDQILADIHGEDRAFYGAKDGEAAPVAPTAIAEIKSAAQTLDIEAQRDLDFRAQKEKQLADARRAEERARERIKAGEETFFEKRGREAAERLAARKKGPTAPEEIRKAAEETDTLFQSEDALDPQDFDDLRDVAADLLSNGISDERVFQSIRGRFGITPSQGKDVMRAARKLLKVAKAEGEIPKAAPRIVELYREGLNYADISRVLETEFPDLTKGRHKRAWTQALEDAGIKIETAREARYTWLKSEMDKAGDRIRGLHGKDEPFFKISAALSEEFPSIPKSRHEEAFTRALKDTAEMVATRVNEQGEIKVFLAGRSISVPKVAVADIVNFANTKLMGLRTETRLVDRLTNRGELLRAWLVENREKSVTAMVKERTDWRGQLLNDQAVQFLRHDKAASALVQKLGEGVIGVDELKQLRPNDWQKIVKADEWFRAKYEELLERVNEALVKFGQKPIPWRRNYYTHFQERATVWQRITGGDNTHGGILSEVLDVSGGRVSQGRRNTSWNPWAQKRLGDTPFVYDALGAFEAYLDPTLAQIHLTKPAMRRRVLAKVLEANADYLREGRETPEGFTIDSQYVQAADAADKFAQVLNAQADNLVGQRGAFDKAADAQAAMVEPLGVMAKVLKVMARRAAASKIVGSIRSAVMQTSGLALAVPELGVTNLAAAAAENAKRFAENVAGKRPNRFGGLKDDPVLAKSDFLARRYADTSSVRETLATRMIEAANYPMEFIEQNVAETIWRAAYDRAKISGNSGMGKVRGGLGLSDEAAVAYADRITERILAGRAKGEKPIVYNTDWGKIVFQFQLEQGNFVEFLGQDFLFDNGRRLNAKELAWKSAKLTGALYVLNTIYQEILGASPLPDPVRTLEDELEILRSELDPLEKVQRALGRILGEGLSAIPGGSTAAGFVPEYDIFGSGLNRRDLLGDTEAGTFAGGMAASDLTWQLLSNEWATVLVRDMVIPAGGTQVQRTMRGIDAITEGALSKPVSKRQSWWQTQIFNFVKSGTYDTRPVEFDPTKEGSFADAIDKINQRRKYKVESPDDQIRALIFGPGGTQAARAYYDKLKAKGLKPKPGSMKIRLPAPG